MSLWAKHTSARFLLFEKVVGMVPVRLQTHVKVSATKAARQSLVSNLARISNRDVACKACASASFPSACCKAELNI